jgi:hypothetical protein
MYWKERRRGWDYSSTWVGLDGAGSGVNDVPQAGSSADAYCVQPDNSSSSENIATNYAFAIAVTALCGCI